MSTVWNLLLWALLLLILLLLHKLIHYRCRRCRSFLVPRPPRLSIRSGQGGLLFSLLSKLTLPEKSTKLSKNQLKKAKRRARSRAHVNPETETDKTNPKSADDDHSRAHVNSKTDKTNPKSGDDNTKPKPNPNLKANFNTKPRAMFPRAGLSCPDLHGMDNYENQLMDFLEDETTPMVGILGMAGVGKTTLLYLMRTYYDQLRYFRYIFLVEAGKDFKIDKLSAALSWGIAFGPKPEVNLISSFLRNQSFLLLLDDLQCAVDLADAGLPMKLGPKQKIVFATRDETVLAEMGCEGNTLQMHCLDEVTAWNLFMYLVGDKIINSHPNIKDLAKKMVAGCRGNPGALCTLGGLMSTKTKLDSWIVMHDILVKSPSSSCVIEDAKNGGYPYLRFRRNYITK